MKILLIMSLLLSVQFLAADTYNFYFQKGKSPKSVTQGKDGQNVIMEDEEEYEEEEEEPLIESEDITEDTSEPENIAQRKEVLFEEEKEPTTSTHIRYFHNIGQHK